MSGGPAISAAWLRLSMLTVSSLLARLAQIAMGDIGKPLIIAQDEVLLSHPVDATSSSCEAAANATGNIACQNSRRWQLHAWA